MGIRWPGAGEVWRPPRGAGRIRRSETGPRADRVRLASASRFVCLRPGNWNRWPQWNRARPDGKADVPAQEARPEARTRLPGSHGFAGWSPRARPQTSKGAQQAVRL